MLFVCLSVTHLFDGLRRMRLMAHRCVRVFWFQVLACMQTQVCVLIVVFVYVMHVFDVLAFSSYLYGCVRVCAGMCGCVRERERVCGWCVCVGLWTHMRAYAWL